MIAFLYEKLSKISSTKLERLFLFGGIFTMISLICVMLYVICTMYYPYELFITKPDVWAIRAEDRVVKPGGSVFVDIEVCKYTNLPAEIGLMLVGKTKSGADYLQVLPTVSGYLGLGCQHRYVHVTEVPKNTPPGNYKIVITIVYKLNAFRNVNHRFVTDTFEVQK